MARRIRSKIKISGSLLAQTALHFGGNEVNADTDMALAVNGRGDYYVAGTNLTGLLRAWMIKVVGGDITLEDIDRLWGFQTEDYGHASFIIVEDGAIALPVGLTSEIRDGVGIDRYWGTAADKQKYDREIVPKGSKIALNLIVERCDRKSDAEWEREKHLLTELLTALQNRELRFGGGKTRGLGKVRLVGLKIKEQPDLLTPQGILSTLRGQDPEISLATLSSLENSFAKPAQLQITIDWKPVTPVMLKSEQEGIAVDILPLVSGNNNGLSLVISGSAIKGVLRSQGERIVRTVCGSDLPDDFLTQVQVELVKTVFGSAAQIDDGRQQGYQGALAIDDCYADVSFTPQQWNEIKTAVDSEKLLKALASAGLSSMQQAFHVAIDRWTGGAADGALYSVLEPMGIEWSPLELTLDLVRLKRDEGDEKYLPRVALLFLVLRDLMNRRIPLSFGTNRGMGDIEVEKIKIEGIKNLSELGHSKNITLTKSELSQKNTEFFQRLTAAWQDWINNEVEK